MKFVVIGGHSRNIGKTSVMAALIGASRTLDWTAVKITQYGHGICSLDGEPCGCAPRHHPFEITEEKNSAGRSDTCRFLAAGARLSLWLRVRQGQLTSAYPSLQHALAGSQYVIMESNSILGLIEPDLYLFVLDGSRVDFKPSARQYLARADALVPIGPAKPPRSWAGLQLSGLESKPAFPVVPPSYSSPELSRFVLEKLA